MKKLMVVTALAGLIAAGCSSNRAGAGGSYDSSTRSTGAATSTTPSDWNTAPLNGSGGPVRGPGTGGMGNPETAPYEQGTPSSPQGWQNPAPH